MQNNAADKIRAEIELVQVSGEYHESRGWSAAASECRAVADGLRRALRFVEQEATDAK